MKAILAGKALVVTSSLKTADIKRAAKICPDALVLKDEDKRQIFAVSASEKNAGIGSIGINFDTITAEGYAQLTLPMDKAPDKEALADQFGVALIRLTQVEAQFATAYTAEAAKLSAVVEGIEGVE